jgi:hypothetical protein
MRSAMRVGVDPRNSADTIGQRYRKLMVDRLRRLDAKQARLMAAQEG